jgi:hypothetical protein
MRFLSKDLETNSPKVLLTYELLRNTMDAHLSKRSQTMKKYSAIIYIVSLACAGLIFTGCATNQASAPIPPNSGHLLINRVANFGSDLSLVVFIDGKNVGGFTEGRSYSGYLPAGQHQIAVRVDPNPGGKHPGHKTLTVQAGQTYSYTAAWSGQNLALVRNP